MKTNAPNKTLLAATCAVLLAGSNAAWAWVWNTGYVRVDDTTRSTASGTSALSGSTGFDNTAHGYNALLSNTTGAGNTANGASALYSNTSGSYNTATGVKALYSNTIGNNNTATGAAALYSNISGSYNTATGFYALYKNTTGSYNTAVGVNALYYNYGGNNNTAFGLQALQNNSNGNGNTAVGVNALYNNTSGSANTAMGRNALYSNTTGKYNTAIGFGADVSTGALTNATAIGYNAKVNASNKVRIGDIYVNKIEGQVSWSSSSDKRLKSNIADLPLGLDFISKLRPVEYIRNNNTEKTKEWGLIAQELQQTLKEVGYKDAGVVSDDKTSDHYMTVRYNDLLAPMIKAIQELEEEKTEQQTTQEKQQTIAALLNRIEMLEKKAK